MQDRRQFLIMTGTYISVDCCYTQVANNAEANVTFVFNVQEMRIEGIASSVRG